MSRWTDEELRELVTLWPTNSASQIAKRLHRLRSAIRSKAERLRQEGLLAAQSSPAFRRQSEAAARNKAWVTLPHRPAFILPPSGKDAPVAFWRMSDP